MKQLDCILAWRAIRLSRRHSLFSLLLQSHFPQLIWPYCFLLPVSHLLAPLDNHSLFLGTAQKCFPPTVPRAVQFSLGDWCQIAHLDIRPFVRPVLWLRELRHFIEHPCTPTGKATELPPVGGQTLAWALTHLKKLLVLHRMRVRKGSQCWVPWLWHPDGCSASGNWTQCAGGMPSAGKEPLYSRNALQGLSSRCKETKYTESKKKKIKIDFVQENPATPPDGLLGKQSKLVRSTVISAGSSLESCLCA